MRIEEDKNKSVFKNHKRMDVVYHTIIYYICRVIIIEEEVVC